MSHQSDASLGTVLRLRRVAAGITQVELAESVGTGQTSVSQWERGVTTPTLVHLRRLALALDCDLVDLLVDP